MKEQSTKEISLSFPWAYVIHSPYNSTRLSSEIILLLSALLHLELCAWLLYKISLVPCKVLGVDYVPNVSSFLEFLVLCEPRKKLSWFAVGQQSCRSLFSLLKVHLVFPSKCTCNRFTAGWCSTIGNENNL